MSFHFTKRGSSRGRQTIEIAENLPNTTAGKKADDKPEENVSQEDDNKGLASVRDVGKNTTPC
eukprot:jgi/Mesen1/1132/ME000123S00306